MNMKKTIIIISSLCLVVACNQQADNNQSSNKKVIKEEQAEVKVQKPNTLKEEVVKNKEKFLANKVAIEEGAKKSLFINGEKFIVHGKTLKKGTNVYSPSIRQVGVVKGSVVVVTKQLTGNQLTEKYKTSSITEIAVNTFQLTPDDTEDLYRFYQTLLNSELIEQVELAINYSGIQPMAETQ